MLLRTLFFFFILLLVILCSVFYGRKRKGSSFIRADLIFFLNTIHALEPVLFFFF